MLAEQTSHSLQEDDKACYGVGTEVDSCAKKGALAWFNAYLLNMSPGGVSQWQLLSACWAALRAA